MRDIDPRRPRLTLDNGWGSRVMLLSGGDFQPDDLPFVFETLHRHQFLYVKHQTRDLNPKLKSAVGRYYWQLCYGVELDTVGRPSRATFTFTPFERWIDVSLVYVSEYSDGEKLRARFELHTKHAIRHFFAEYKRMLQLRPRSETTYRKLNLATIRRLKKQLLKCLKHVQTRDAKLSFRSF